jgi:hypothetical protein
MRTRVAALIGLSLVVAGAAAALVAARPARAVDFQPYQWYWVGSGLSRSPSAM